MTGRNWLPAWMIHVLAARAADLRDVGYRVLRILIGAEETVTEFPNEPVVVLAEEIIPVGYRLAGP